VIELLFLSLTVEALQGYNPPSPLFLLACIPPSIQLTELGVLRMLPVLQRLGNAHGF